MKNLTISVIGLGYIGLPTAALLASKGYSVFGIDVCEHVVNTINEGKIHIVESDLDTFVHSAVTAGQLKAFSEPQAADVFIICVPTPFHKDEGIPKPNIDYVLTATKSIVSLVNPGNLIILESTSPVGTTEKIQSVLRDGGINVDEVYIAYCPERVLPGKIMTEIVQNDRIVGGITPKATKVVADFYKTFVRGSVHETDAITAEMCKLTENSFRDVNIAFANELSLICDKEGVNVWDLIKLANQHPRVNILQPGTGVGGHCIAVDPWFIVSRDQENSRLIKTAREVNDFKTNWVVEKIKSKAIDFQNQKGYLPKIACFGLAFKPDVDDLRESPSLEVFLKLTNANFNVLAVEPNITEHSKIVLSDLNAALIEADLIVLLVKHKEFLEPSFQEELCKRQVLDFCGSLN